MLLEVRILQLDVSDEKDRDIGFIVNANSQKFGNANAGFMQNPPPERDVDGETETVTDSGGTTSRRKSSSSETKLGPLDVAGRTASPTIPCFSSSTTTTSCARTSSTAGAGPVAGHAKPSCRGQRGVAHLHWRYALHHDRLHARHLAGLGHRHGDPDRHDVELRVPGHRDLLVISPKIHTDGTVTLRILQENSTPADVNPVETKVGTFYEQPIKKEIITSAVVAKDGETVALGG